MFDGGTMKIYKNKLIVGVLSLTALLSIFIFAFAGGLRAQNAPPLKRVVLKLKWKHQFQFAGYYAAIEKGLYQKAGLDVVLVEPGEDDDPVKDVMESKAQFGIGTSTLMLDHAAGKPIVVLAPIFQHSPTVLVALKKSASRPEELAGKKLMIEPQSADIITYLQSFGVPLSKCILYPHAYSPEPLIKGEVDAITAYLTDEPFLLRSAGVEYHIFSPVEAGIDFYGDTLFTTKEYIAKEPENVEKFRRASIEGWIYAFNNADEIIKLILDKYSKRHVAEHLKFEAEQMKKYVIPEVIQIGYSKPERWSQIAAIYKKQNLVPLNYTMEGFLYEDYVGVKVVYHVWPVLIISLIAIFISFLANFYYKLNLKLKDEITQRRASEENLAKSEERYRTLVENIPIPISITNLESRELLYINSVFESTFRVNKSFIIGKQGDIFYDNPAVRDEVFKLIKNYGYLKDHIVIFKDVEGRVLWISLSANIIEYGDARSVFFMLNDISDKIKREGEFSKLNSAKDRFLKITASDLRSSIGTFQSILDYLIKNFGILKEPEKTDFLYSLKNCADSTYALLINLLEWTSNAAGDLKPAPSLVAVTPAVSEIFELFSERAAKKQLKFESSVDEKLRVYCDENMFKTTLRNVVSNAVKFTLPGGVIKVSVGEDAGAAMVKLIVSDTGVGISCDRIDRLFDINGNFSTEGTDGERGSGIGLVLSNDFIIKNYGELKIESFIGSGTSVTIMLPSRPEKS
jgi:PAS domain S-box-containing protein